LEIRQGGRRQDGVAPLPGRELSLCNSLSPASRLPGMGADASMEGMLINTDGVRHDSSRGAPFLDKRRNSPEDPDCRATGTLTITRTEFGARSSMESCKRFLELGDSRRGRLAVLIRCAANCNPLWLDTLGSRKLHAFNPKAHHVSL
jgi:hypothetical protein